MASEKPRIAIPVATSADLAYNQRNERTYADAVQEAGGVPVPVSLALDRRALRALFDACDGICLPGSPADVDPARYGAERDPASAPADPDRETTDFALLDLAAAGGKPVLGICYGLQSLNVWCGGSLVQDLHSLPINHAAGASVAVAHNVMVHPESQLVAWLEAGEAPLRDGFLRLPVNTSHHQAVASPGEGLRVVARCPDDGVIEAVELDPAQAGGAMPPWMLGVQWHPERTTAISAASRSLFRRLVVQAAESSRMPAASFARSTVQ